MNIIRTLVSSTLAATLLLSCGAGRKESRDSVAVTPDSKTTQTRFFSADSAYANIVRQVSFGPRVPGTPAHRACGDWLASRLKGFGAEVMEQKAELTTFDGTRIPMRNIFARFNPEAEKRTLLLAHWDTRPWADNDPDPALHKTPIDGANDGASGVGVLLELARLAGEGHISHGIDILLCDAEDWGTENNDESWAMGARYFVNHPPVEGYMPQTAILLDMVGAHGATFMREYFSQQAAPALADKIWATAASLGHGAMFVNRMGSAVNDDHVELIKGGIPAIDIIDYREDSGFFSGWHTTADNMDCISRETLEAVGTTMETFLGN